MKNEAIRMLVLLVRFICVWLSLNLSICARAHENLLLKTTNNKGRMKSKENLWLSRMLKLSLTLVVFYVHFWLSLAPAPHTFTIYHLPIQGETFVYTPNVVERHSNKYDSHTCMATQWEHRHTDLHKIALAI